MNNLGYDVVTLRDEKQLGLKNGDVAQLAIIKHATIITLDSDFLSIRRELQKKCKIIYIKIHPRDPKIIAKIVQKYLKDAVAKLSIPGKIIISENDFEFKLP